MTATHSREYYRALSTGELVTRAREEGLNPEMAIAVIERLAVLGVAQEHGQQGEKRGFEFNNGGNVS